MTRIFIDHQKFTTQKYGGISRYFANVMQGIRSADDMGCQLGVLNAKNHYIRHESLPLRGRLSDRVLQYREKYTYKLNQAYCNYLLDQQQFDVFHPTYYDPYFLPRLKKPLVITLHDMTYERLPEYFWALDPLTRQKRLNIEKADAIIAISNTTRNDLLSFFDVDPAKITVIYHGIDIADPKQSRPVAPLPPDYLLFVGDRSGYKNFYLFLNAFRELAPRHPDLHVVLAGGGSLGIADVEFIHRLKLGERVHHIHATDEELNWLYAHAQLFVYPSLYEGFGLPILEAFRAGCPMVLSDTDCFREVAGNAAAFFSPQSPEDLVRVLDTTLGDTARKQALIASGNRRLLDFPLDKSIENTLNVYRTFQ